MITIHTSVVGGRMITLGGAETSPGGDVSCLDGGHLYCEWIGDDGKVLQGVLVDGASIGTPLNYTFMDIRAEHTIAVTFVAPVLHTITVTASAGGTVSPSGAVSVADGATQVFTFTPAAGYYIKKVTADGTIDCGAPVTMSVTACCGDHTIYVEFAETAGDPPAAGVVPVPGDTYVVVPVGGTVDPTGAVISDVYATVVDRGFQSMYPGPYGGPRHDRFVPYEGPKSGIAEWKRWMFDGNFVSGAYLSPKKDVYNILCGTAHRLMIYDQFGTLLYQWSPPLGNIASYQYDPWTGDVICFVDYTPEPVYYPRGHYELELVWSTCRHEFVNQWVWHSEYSPDVGYLGWDGVYFFFNDKLEITNAIYPRLNPEITEQPHYYSNEYTGFHYAFAFWGGRSGFVIYAPGKLATTGIDSLGWMWSGSMDTGFWLENTDATYTGHGTLTAQFGFNSAPIGVPLARADREVGILDHMDGGFLEVMSNIGFGLGSDWSFYQFKGNVASHMYYYIGNPGVLWAITRIGTLVKIKEARYSNNQLTILWPGLIAAGNPTAGHGHMTYGPDRCINGAPIKRWVWDLEPSQDRYSDPPCDEIVDLGSQSLYATSLTCGQRSIVLFNHSSIRQPDETYRQWYSRNEYDFSGNLVRTCNINWNGIGYWNESHTYWYAPPDPQFATLTPKGVLHCTGGNNRYFAIDPEGVMQFISNEELPVDGNLDGPRNYNGELVSAQATGISEPAIAADGACYVTCGPWLIKFPGTGDQSNAVWYGQ